VYFVCAASDKDYMVEERAQRPVYCSILQYTAVYCSILQYTEMFLIFFLIFLVTCGCWGVAGLADEKDENRLYALVLDHHARSWIPLRQTKLTDFLPYPAADKFPAQQDLAMRDDPPQLATPMQGVQAARRLLDNEEGAALVAARHKVLTLLGNLR